VTKTQVLFKWDSETEEAVAFFPTIPSSVTHPELFTCYQHTGQHGSACKEYYESLPNATKDQITPLKRELEGIGYELDIKVRYGTSFDRQRLNQYLKRW
jgi:hypothetical protein